MSILKAEKRTSFFLLLIFIAAIVVILYFQNKKNSGNSVSQDGTPLNSEIQLDFFPIKGIVHIEPDITTSNLSSNGWTALDGMSHEDIAAFRLDKVKEYNQLNFFDSDYHPFKSHHKLIYQSIAPGELWTKGAAYFIANPYLLIILTCANHVTPLHLYCPEVNITYKDGVIEEVYSGRGALCWFKQVYNSDDFPGQVWPIMANAWDAGFFFTHVDLSRSENIEGSDNSNHITNTFHSRMYFYHVGKYKKNNLSPSEINAWLQLKKRDVNTLIYIKLWRKRPKTPATSPDLVYIVKIIP